MFRQRLDLIILEFFLSLDDVMILFYDFKARFYGALSKVVWWKGDL